MIDRHYRTFNESGFVFVPVSGDFADFGGYSVVNVEGRASRSRFFHMTPHGAFDLIGTVAIIKIRNVVKARNMAERLLESQKTVSSVYLDDGISGPFRLRKLTLLTGEDNTLTRYKENDVTMILDVSKVYFSPRLATERMLVSKSVRDGEEIVDMFSGIGPFSINIARIHQCLVHAIDSNPDSIRFMKESISLNRLPGSIIPHEGDAAEIVPQLGKYDRIIMNLPRKANLYLELALSNLVIGGVVYYYEILDAAGVEQRMEEFRKLHLTLLKKRVVHGYSYSESMYSFWLEKH